MAVLLRFWLLLCLLQHLTLFATSSHMQECTIVVDIVFMIDSSQSMGNQEFADTKAFIGKVIPHLNPSSKGTHVGILAFANSANIKHSFTDKQDISTIQKALDDILLFGTANTIIAFNEAKRQINKPHGHGNQHKRRRVLVVASNGKYPYPSMAIPAAQQLKDDGIVIISLGLESFVDRAQLESVATSVDQVVTPTTKSDVSAIADLLSMICAVDRKPEVVVSRSAEESALRGHVIGTVHAWDDFACAFSCLHTKNCFSFNFKERSQVCELNHSNKLASPQDLVIDLDSSYYELDFS
ncbi:hypothetical protein ACROYT_G001831 [Oculina patagonica]